MQRTAIKNVFRLVTIFACITAGALAGWAQFGPETEGGAGGAGPPKGPVKHADDPIKITAPIVDKKAGTVTLPAAFWNQMMTNWVEVAVCGRPSDFLHETIVCIMCTKRQMMQAMRDAGFHDADQWVSSVQDFPRIRGDRFTILLQVTRNGKQETYALDELLNYQGWGVPAGPYGWMYKGDPEHEEPTAAPDQGEADRTQILRDDPQIALVLKGIQHRSDSFAENPMAYDDWVYPAMRYSRNYRLLPDTVYNSNGDVPVTMVIQKVTEEQFLTQMAKVWHDPAFSAYMLKQMPAAKEIDLAKSELWSLLPAWKKLRATPAETRDARQQAAVFGKVTLLTAQIEKGYAEMDAAWAAWACDHPVFDTTDDNELAALKGQVNRWREHMQLKKTRAQQLAAADKAAFDLQQLEQQPQTPAATAQIQKLRGIELEARSAAMIAHDVQPAVYWKHEQSRVDPNTDPRTDWIKQINTQVEMLDARAEVGKAGLAYGRALQSDGPSQVASAKRVYAQAIVQMSIANIKVRLADVDFEISKRESLEGDTDLPKFKAEKTRLEAQLKEAQAATQPGEGPAAEGHEREGKVKEKNR